MNALLGLTTEISANLVELPRNVTTRKALKGTRFKAMSTHHGSRLHSKEVFDHIGDELKKVFDQYGKNKKGRTRATKVLESIALEVEKGELPGMH